MLLLVRTSIRLRRNCARYTFLTAIFVTSYARFEIKIFRRMYGPKYENGEWKSRTNRELEEMSKGENVVKWIKGQRISWLGHLERMEEDRMPKKIFTQELEGTRRRGGPRKRWKEQVVRDLHVLGVRRWRELVADRKKWKDIVLLAKIHSGLTADGRRRNVCDQLTPFNCNQFILLRNFCLFCVILTRKYSCSGA